MQGSSETGVTGEGEMAEERRRSGGGQWSPETELGAWGEAGPLVGTKGWLCFGKGFSLRRSGSHKDGK